MLMSRSCALLLGAALLPAALVLTSCSKTKQKPEVRLARTSVVSDASTAGGPNGAAGDASLAYAPGQGWAPGDAPPAGGMNATGSVTRGATSSAAGSATLDETGGLMNNASTAGVEDGAFTAELEMVHFEYDSDVITDSWKSVLAEHATWINQTPAVMVQVEGHCDERGTEEYNVSLGQRRADAVRAFLVEKGVDANRLSTISYGKMRPLSFDANDEAMALNRRAMFLVYSSNEQAAAPAGEAVASAGSY